MMRLKDVSVTTSVLSAAVFAFSASTTQAATTLFGDGFEANASNNVTPVGWTTYKNWTANPSTGDTAPSTWETTGPGAGHPFYGHNWPDDSGRFVAAAGNGSPGTIDLWLVSPQLAINGQETTVSFWTFSLGGSSASLEVLLSGGSGVVPNNGGAKDNGLPTPLTGGVGDFTTKLLDINPTHADGGYPAFDDTFTPNWTEYTATIPAGAVSGIGYVAFRILNSNVYSPTSYRIVGIDDVAVTAVPEPTTLGLAAAVGLGLLRRRRATV